MQVQRFCISRTLHRTERVTRSRLAARLRCRGEDVCFWYKADMEQRLIELLSGPWQRVGASRNEEPRFAIWKNIRGRVFAGPPELQQLGTVLGPVAAHFVRN